MLPELYYTLEIYHLKRNRFDYQPLFKKGSYKKWASQCGLHNLYFIRLRTVTSQSRNNRLTIEQSSSKHLYSFFFHFDNQHLAPEEVGHSSKCVMGK